jgi:peptide/nickel transport system permease protein
MGLWLFMARRMLTLIPVLLAASFLVFLLVHLTPTSPVELLLGSNATPEQIERLYRELGLDRPFLEQYAQFVARTTRGNFGISLKTGRPVWQDIRDRFGATVELAATAFLLIVILGILAGIVSALHPEGLVDHSTRIMAILGAAVPVFWFGLLLQLLFFSTWHLLPLNGRIDTAFLLDHSKRITGLLLLDTMLAKNWAEFRSVLLHLILPAVALAYRSLALVMRMTRSSLLEALQQDYIRTASAFGHSRRRIVIRHALPNALIPVLTVLGFDFGRLLGGTLLVESIFDWPGLGLYAFDAIAFADIPALLGVSITLTLIFVLINLAVDIGYMWLDPRIRYE